MKTPFFVEDVWPKKKNENLNLDEFLFEKNKNHFYSLARPKLPRIVSLPHASLESEEMDKGSFDEFSHRCEFSQNIL